MNKHEESIRDFLAAKDDFDKRGTTNLRGSYTFDDLRGCLAEIASLRKDAERYRWVRLVGIPISASKCDNFRDFDAAIDAMEASK